MTWRCHNEQRCLLATSARLFRSESMADVLFTKYLAPCGTKLKHVHLVVLLHAPCSATNQTIASSLAQQLGMVWRSVVANHTRP
jgi:hypothetical protein